MLRYRVFPKFLDNSELDQSQVSILLSLPFSSFLWNFFFFNFISPFLIAIHSYFFGLLKSEKKRKIKNGKKSQVHEISADSITVFRDWLSAVGYTKYAHSDDTFCRQFCCIHERDRCIKCTRCFRWNESNMRVTFYSATFHDPIYPLYPYYHTKTALRIDPFD